MTTSASDRSAVEDNRLLRALEERERTRIIDAGERVRLSQKEVLLEPDQPHTHVYFPADAVISLLTTFRDGGAVEVGTVGCEGMVGLPVYLGTGAMPVLTMAQIPGDVLRVPAGSFARLLEELPRIRIVLDRYTQAFLSQVFQAAACHGHHDIEARCARWLLMTHDRVGSRQFALTHELLAYMLGVRRAGVTEAAGALQQAGVIRYNRGRVEVIDRAGLEAASCECYGVIRRVYEELLGSEAAAGSA